MICTELTFAHPSALNHLSFGDVSASIKSSGYHIVQNIPSVAIGSNNSRNSKAIIVILHCKCRCVVGRISVLRTAAKYLNHIPSKQKFREVEMQRTCLTTTNNTSTAIITLRSELPKNLQNLKSLLSSVSCEILLYGVPIN